LSLTIDEHRQYLVDTPRLSAFQAAVESVVRPGQVVLDLGSGTGIMGLFACRAGARLVYSIEVGGMLGVAREVAQANGYGDRVVFIKGHSTHVNLPEKVDVVVADQIGNFGFNAGVIQYFADARRRFLKPEGVTVPMGMNLMLAPVEAPDLFGQVEFWGTSPAGFDFSSTRVLAANTGYQVDLSPQSLCGDVAVIASIDLNHATTEPFHAEATAAISRPGTMHGLGGWFVAQLAAGISMTNSPLSPERIHRRQIYFPVERAVQVTEGDLVRIRMTVRPTDSVVNWNVEVLDGSSGARKDFFRHSTWKGMLLASEDLTQTRPGFKPKLIPRGEARQTVVNLCDGARTLAEIEDEVFRRHPNLFRTREEAAVFVAEVVTRYTQ
jgi:Arginine methyltransferase oligomerization subdomain/Ribosomal protein L11 methyltransferase (PrmA)